MLVGGAAAGALFTSASCASCPPETRALALRPDYSTPELAGASFFAAMACDDADGEYRAFGERLKARHGATLDLWLLARPSVREELGLAVRFARRLRPARSETREDGVLVWWEAAGRERVGLLMQAQHFLECVEADGRRVGIPLQRPPGAWLQVEGKRLRIDLAVEDPVLRGLSAAGVTRITLATEWKIADWLLPEEPPADR